METVGREDEMFAQTKSRQEKEFLLEEVEEYRGDVSWLTAIIHHADFPGLEKPKVRRQRKATGLSKCSMASMAVTSP